jgi:hypothetical protein
MKLLRTIRLDPSDTFVFERAAEPGEWAVSGAFMFMDAAPEALTTKARTAMRAGLLGVDSFGWSTLCVVTPISAAEREAATARLAEQIRDQLGAPDLAIARRAAEEEIAFAMSLCDHPENTLIAVHRSVEEDGLQERFRTLTPRAEERGAAGVPGGFRAFDFFEVVEDETPAIEERVDLAGMLKDRA